jgi:hypothetical protein
MEVRQEVHARTSFERGVRNSASQFGGPTGIQEIVVHDRHTSTRTDVLGGEAPRLHRGEVVVDVALRLPHRLGRHVPESGESLVPDHGGVGRRKVPGGQWTGSDSGGSGSGGASGGSDSGGSDGGSN